MIAPTCGAKARRPATQPPSPQVTGRAPAQRRDGAEGSATFSQTVVCGNDLGLNLISRNGGTVTA